MVSISWICPICFPWFCGRFRPNIRFRRFLGVFGAMRLARPRNEHSLLQSSVSWCFNWSNAIKGLGSNDLAAWLPRISKAGRRRLESPPPVCVSSVCSSVCVFCLFGCFWWQQGSVFNMELLVSIYIYIYISKFHKNLWPIRPSLYPLPLFWVLLQLHPLATQVASTNPSRCVKVPLSISWSPSIDNMFPGWSQIILKGGCLVRSAVVFLIRQAMQVLLMFMSRNTQ